MNKKIYQILLLIVLSGTTVIAANIDGSTALAKSATTTIENTKQMISSWFMTEKGEIFLLNPGESETIVAHQEEITVELLEIGYNPEEISDLNIDYVTFSNNNPEPGEEIEIEVSITNMGTGIAYGATLDMIYGDENQGNGGQPSPAIMEIQPGETAILESYHTYWEEGEYTVMATAQVSNDINNGNNVVCEEITVGNPQGGAGGCGALAPNDIPKKAHILYSVYRGSTVVDQQELWLNPSDIGSTVEVLKLSDSQALLTVPM